MDGSVTVSMAAPADTIWELIADVRNTGKFSPEVMEAEWLDGATGPALSGAGARVAASRGPTPVSRTFTHSTPWWALSR